MLLAFLASGLGGCANHPVRLNVTVELDPDYAKELVDGPSGGRRFDVNIVGMNANQAATWSKKSMTQYWDPNNADRASMDAVTFTFDPKDPKTFKQTLSKDDPHWSKWQVNQDPITDKPDKQDMPRLFILAQLPPPPGQRWGEGTALDKPGNDDPRRQILPLGDNRWKVSGGMMGSTVQTDVLVKIQKSGLTTVTSFVKDIGQ